MQDENTRNTIIFVVCAFLILIGYQFFVIEPANQKKAAEAKQRPAAAQTGPARPAPTLGVQPLSREEAVATGGPRLPIETPALKGSISMRGGRLDDLWLIDYRQTLAKNSPAVELLRLKGSQFAWFANIGWVGANVPGLPSEDTVWSLVSGSELAPGKPVTLSYANGQGLTFTRVIAVDEKYMFTFTDTVANTSATPITLAPYGSIQRQGVPPGLGRNGVVHEGGVGWLQDKRRTLKYAKWQKDGSSPEYASTGGWIGITDIYWLTALIPAQNEQIRGQYRLTKTPGLNVLDANYVGQARTILPGRQATSTVHVFAGAKEAPALKAYQEKIGVENLDEAIDWGMLWFLTRPIFSFLSFIFHQVGNFGVAILLLTVVVRLVLFPMANKQYESMTKMKKVQPAMEELRKKFKDDPQRQQQELLALYQREKVNPLAGCLPLLLTIPIFFALFKVLQITIEMRHAPFIGFIRDLSAPDPTSVLNLFGLIPWDPSSVAWLAHGGMLGFFNIGIMAILYGVTTWLTTAMSPPAPDPMQQRIFQLMPILFTFIMATFPVGLLLYYTWSNILTAIQQYVIMRRFKVDNPIDQLISRITRAGKAVG